MGALQEQKPNTTVSYNPRKIMIGVSGVLQAYGRPFIVKIRSKNE